MAILRLFTYGGCSSCERFMNEVKQREDILKDYTVKVIDLKVRNNKAEGLKYGIKSVPSYVLKHRNTVTKQSVTAINFKRFASDLCT